MSFLRTARVMLVGFGLFLPGPGSSLLSAEEKAVGDSGSAAALFERFCFDCHAGDDPEGEIRLTNLHSQRELLEQRQLWERVIEQLDSEEMPPEKPFPSGEERAAMIDWIRENLEKVDWSKYRSPGPITLPRLTRAEYRNTLRDLLGVDLDAGADLPEDGEGPSGFVNDREALSLTPAALELYLESAERALDGAFELARQPRQWRFEAEELELSDPGKMRLLGDGIMVIQPGHELHATVRFPVDGWYEFRVTGAVFGKSCVALIRVGGEPVAEARVSGTKPARPEVVRVTGFVRRGIHPVTISSKNLVPQKALPPDIVRTVDDAAKRRAPRLPKLSDSESEAVREAREALNYKAYGVQESYEWLRVFGPDADSRKIDLRRVYLRERQAQWDVLRDKLAAVLEVDPAEVDRLWRRENTDRLADNAALLAAVAPVEWSDWMHYQGKLYLDQVAVAGPVNPGRVSVGWTLIDALADDSLDPVTLAEQFLARAFRRPVASSEVERYARLVRDSQRRGDDRESALKLAFSAALVSPDFLFWTQPDAEFAADGARQTVPLTDYELGSRLSYFLWLSMPDDHLLDLAANGDLSDPSVLIEKANRMLSDPKAKAFLEAFTSDWLGIRHLGGSIRPDPARFPEFTSELAASMRTETERFVAAIFQNDRPLTDLLDSRETFLNRELARHYGLEFPGGEGFRPVNLKDGNRGGLLGMGSVLVATSSPARTNPVRRGAWVLERILGEDPGEPLADAGELPGNAGEARGKTLREELAAHSNRAECARCHDRIDPIGFGLQNFDAVGRWRDREAGQPVDASGRLPDGREFSGPVELKAILLERRDDFLRNLTARMLAFALGRELEFYDQPLVDEIAAKVKAAGFSARRLVREIVSSEAFRMREIR